jgi:serine/threonine protein kinase
MQGGTLNFNDRFADLTQVGAGSMGTVYKAWDREARTHVALKLLHNASTAARFERESRVLAQIAHPNIVRYVAHGIAPGGLPWLAMEWLEGCDLDTMLKTGVLSPSDALRLARALTSGLSWAHDRGFIHRDLKPSNVFVPPAGLDHAKVVDFGLARDVVADDALTKTGMLIGTLEYMPPEQVSDAKRADARADVFSLGAVLYRSLTGVPPAKGHSLPEILMNILRGTIPPLTAYRQDVPPPFASLITNMLEKNADLRPANATHVAMALDAIDVRPGAVLDLDVPTEQMAQRPAYLQPQPPTAYVPPPGSLSGTLPAPVSSRGRPSWPGPLPGPRPSGPDLPTTPYGAFTAPDPITVVNSPANRYPPRPAPRPPSPASTRRVNWLALGLLTLAVAALVIALFR